MIARGYRRKPDLTDFAALRMRLDDGLGFGDRGLTQNYTAVRLH